MSSIEFADLLSAECLLSVPFRRAAIIFLHFRLLFNQVQIFSEPATVAEVVALYVVLLIQCASAG